MVLDQAQWAAEEALRQYGQRFGDCCNGEEQNCKQSAKFEHSAAGNGVTPYQVPVDLYPFLGLDEADEDADLIVSGKVQKQSKGATFLYAGSLDKEPPLATFDIRDEVCLLVGGFKHGQVVRDASGVELIVIGVKPLDGSLRLWFQPKALGRAGAGVFPRASLEVLRARFTLVSHVSSLKELSPTDFELIEDQDGECLRLCRHCRLPLGSIECAGAMHVHSECLAQLTLRDLQEEMESSRKEAAALKKQRRAEFEIGWKAEAIPSSLGLLKMLGCEEKQTMYCLVAEESGSARVAPTIEPAASVNLEYLALALQVRCREGREPFFSLDPVDPSDRNSMQEKRFEPAWLAGTSVGEVLFQADYHLKELSMGECEQPVIGMRNCFDLSEDEGAFAWNAREWFVVNKAEIHQSEDGALIPSLKMGVEAREQVLGPNGMEDIKVTREDHPLVKYADAFTENFDLIAERKSVIHKLRELAKASVLAKFLLDAEIPLDDAWFSFESQGSPACCLEIPQLWNERYRSQLRAQDGKVVGVDGLGRKSVRGVYGGVEFGIDKFDLSQPTQNWRLRTAVAPAVPMTGLRLPAPRGVAAPVLDMTLARAARAIPTARGVPEAALAVPRFSKRVKGVGAARGVDLCLDKFDLSTSEQMASQVVQTSATAGSLAGAFWASLAGETEPVFAPEDESLLRQVFNPRLSDRCAEGEHFVPPDTSLAHVDELRRLVKAEEGARQLRKDHFLSTSFSMSSPGPLFPSSWASSVKAQEQAPQAEELRPRADYKAAAQVFEKAVKSATPVFDKDTEDGARFRIYRFGSIEVRTTQEQDCSELIGQIFSASRRREHVKDTEFVVKATEYVEKAALPGKVALAHRCYVVLEMASGRRVLTEKLSDGSLKWEEEPEDLNDRNALAKVIRSAEGREAGVCLGALKENLKSTSKACAAASPAEIKHYAQNAFYFSTGATGSGFRQLEENCKWQRSLEAEGVCRNAATPRLSKQSIRVKCGGK
mmetsp:Transcript_71854/g.166253  ORF Transcript_71854/g.166253 Transcript_71854/m.166253 type:complete len:997 (-) Transcript_71854:140-3130(-)